MKQIVAHLFYLLGADLALGGALLLGYGLTGAEWFKSNFRAWDHQQAAIFGGDGKHSVSAYCGRAILNGGPRSLVWGGIGINAIFGALHCENAARREGLANA